MDNPDINLIDIRDVVVDKNLPPQERFAEFLRQIGGENRFKCGKLVVSVRFADTDDTFEDRIRGFLEACED